MAPSAPAVTPEHLTLIKNTIAKDATPAELELFLYDCARQGVHPLDKLIYFTKRKDRYTPVTSIDFLRTRAADSGECAGIDEPLFHGTPKQADFKASVTVYRIVQGQRYPFTATARWAEYVPDQAFMWQRMPHTMLGKCAEALALRKAFPKQLAGLYVKEEMDQSGNDHTPLQKSLTPSPGLARGEETRVPDVEPGVGAPAVPADLNDSIPAAWKPFVEKSQMHGVIVALDAETRPGPRGDVTKTTVTLDTGECAATVDPEIAAVALELKRHGVVIVTQPHKKLIQQIVSITAADDVQL